MTSIRSVGPVKSWVVRTLIAGVCATGAVSVWAQVTPPKPAIASDEDYSKAMKEVATLNGALRKSLASPPQTDAAAAAARLETIFQGVQAYWEDKKVEDATASAKTAVAAAKAISQAVAAQDNAAASAGAQALGGTCMTCHAAHRERLTFDFYRIK